MMMSNSFDSWQKDAFFSAAEEVQHSADILESAYRTWVTEKRDGKWSFYSDELLREMQTALATAKWQLEEFERAVRLSYVNCGDQKGMGRHREFIVAMESQVSRVEDALRDSLEKEGREPFRWVNLNADERDDLAMFLSGSHGDSTNSSISSNMEKSEDSDFSGCSSSSGAEQANIRANGFTSFKDDIVINIGEAPVCGVKHTGIEALVGTKRTRISQKFSTLRVIVPNGNDHARALIPTAEATPKEKGYRALSHLRFRALNCYNNISLKCLSALKSITRSHGHSHLASSILTVIVLAVLFFLFVLYLIH